jgi:hypothetical protein
MAASSRRVVTGRQRDIVRAAELGAANVHPVPNTRRVGDAVYEYYCEKCELEVQLNLSIREQR